MQLSILLQPLWITWIMFSRQNKFIKFTIITFIFTAAYGNLQCFSLQANQSKKTANESLTHAKWPLAEKDRWVLTSIHNHSVWNFEWRYDSDQEMYVSEQKDMKLFNAKEYDETRNFDIEGYREVQEIAAKEGVEAVFFCEHNTVLQDHLVRDANFPEFNDPQKPLVLLNGTEWTTDAGHISVYDYKYDGPHDGLKPKSHFDVAPQEMATLIAKAKQRGGVSIINHPRFIIKSNKAKEPMGADGVEIMGNAPGMTSRSRAWWHNMLRKGHRWFGVASSDWHRSPYMNFPPAALAGLPDHYNLLRIKGKLTKQALYDALRNGWVQPTTSNDAKRTIEFAYKGESGQYFRSGDSVNTPVDKALVHIKVEGAAGLKLVVITDGDSVEEYSAIQEIDKHSQSFQFNYVRSSKESAFVRAELYDGSTLVQVANPLYLTPKPLESKPL